MRIVRSAPRTLRHDPWAEHRIGERKIESALDARASEPSQRVAEVEFDRAVREGRIFHRVEVAAANIVVSRKDRQTELWPRAHAEISVGRLNRFV